jgi:hypothetical protein
VEEIAAFTCTRIRTQTHIPHTSHNTHKHTALLSYTHMRTSLSMGILWKGCWSSVI